MKRYFNSKYLAHLAIALAAVAIFAYLFYKKQHCGPCGEKAVIVKKEKVTYDREMHRKLFRAKQASALVKSTGYQPHLGQIGRRA